MDCSRTPRPTWRNGPLGPLKLPPGSQFIHGAANAVAEQILPDDVLGFVFVETGQVPTQETRQVIWKAINDINDELVDCHVPGRFQKRMRTILDFKAVFVPACTMGVVVALIRRRRLDTRLAARASSALANRMMACSGLILLCLCGLSLTEEIDRRECLDVARAKPWTQDSLASSAPEKSRIRWRETEVEGEPTHGQPHIPAPSLGQRSDAN